MIRRRGTVQAIILLVLVMLTVATLPFIDRAEAAASAEKVSPEMSTGEKGIRINCSRNAL